MPELAAKHSIGQTTVYYMLHRSNARMREMSGNSHPLWVDGRWQRTYRTLKDRSKCELCGATKNIGIHHLDGNKKNNELSNLISVCQSCHISKYHNDGGCNRKMPLNDDAVRMYNAGLTIECIAQYYTVSPSAVSLHLKGKGVKTRSVKGPRVKRLC